MRTLLAIFAALSVTAAELTLEWDYDRPIDAPATFFVLSTTNLSEPFKVLTNTPVNADLPGTFYTFQQRIGLDNRQKHFFIVALSNFWTVNAVDGVGPKSNITNSVRILDGSITNRLLR